MIPIEEILEDYLTSYEVALFLGIKIETLLNKIKKKKFPPPDITLGKSYKNYGGNIKLWRKEIIAKFIYTNKRRKNQNDNNSSYVC